MAYVKGPAYVWLDHAKPTLGSSGLSAGYVDGYATGQIPHNVRINQGGWVSFTFATPMRFAAIANLYHWNNGGYIRTTYVQAYVSSVWTNAAVYGVAANETLARDFTDMQLESTQWRLYAAAAGGAPYYRGWWYNNPPGHLFYEAVADSEALEMPLLSQLGSQFGPGLRTLLAVPDLAQLGAAAAPSLELGASNFVLPAIENAGVAVSPAITQNANVPLLANIGGVESPSIVFEMAMPLGAQIGSQQALSALGIADVTLPVISTPGTLAALSLDAVMTLPLAQRLGVSFEPSLVTHIELPMLANLGAQLGVRLMERMEMPLIAQTPLMHSPDILANIGMVTLPQLGVQYLIVVLVPHSNTHGIITQTGQRSGVVGSGRRGSVVVSGRRRGTVTEQT